MSTGTNFTHRVHNFSAGPAALPLEVLQQAQRELLSYGDAGASIMEVSHRGKAYLGVHEQAIERLLRLLGADPSEWHVLFMGGGASTQFAMVPMNFLSQSATAGYLNTGSWSKKAIKEAKAFGNVEVLYSSEEHGFNHVPASGDYAPDASHRYVHFTSNNTIFGTQFTAEPDSAGVPLVCDASSDFLSRPIDLDRYGLIYAGAQKNLGPAGVTVVMIKNSFLDRMCVRENPTMFRYGTHIETMFNTPPVFPVYMVNLVLDWLEKQGGLESIQSRNEEKASLLYREIDRDGFYVGTARENSRSRMNVTFRLENQDLESDFIAKAEAAGLSALKGHRSVGGMRASIYNACDFEQVSALVSFMQEYRRTNG